MIQYVFIYIYLQNKVDGDSSLRCVKSVYLLLSSHPRVNKMWQSLRNPKPFTIICNSRMRLPREVSRIFLTTWTNMGYPKSNNVVPRVSSISLPLPCLQALQTKMQHPSTTGKTKCLSTSTKTPIRMSLGGDFRLLSTFIKHPLGVLVRVWGDSLQTFMVQYLRGPWGEGPKQINKQAIKQTPLPNPTNEAKPKQKQPVTLLFNRGTEGP